MDETTMLRAHVERFLEDHWDVPRVTKDADGDYPFWAGTAQGYIRVVPAPGDTCPALVSVFAKAVVGLKSSAALLREVNHLNSRARWAKIFLEDDEVIVAREIDRVGAEPESLALAIDTVTYVADQIGTSIAVVYGGATPNPPH